MYHFLSAIPPRSRHERGVTEPKETFSACFGAPFLPCPQRLRQDARERSADTTSSAGSSHWLDGGPYGVGRRMDLKSTRAMIRAALAASSTAWRRAGAGVRLEVRNTCRAYATHCSMLVRRGRIRLLRCPGEETDRPLPEELRAVRRARSGASGRPDRRLESIRGRSRPALEHIRLSPRLSRSSIRRRSSVCGTSGSSVTHFSYTRAPRTPALSTRWVHTTSPACYKTWKSNSPRCFMTSAITRSPMRSKSGLPLTRASPPTICAAASSRPRSNASVFQQSDCSSSSREGARPRSPASSRDRSTSTSSIICRATRRCAVCPTA